MKSKLWPLYALLYDFYYSNYKTNFTVIFVILDHKKSDVVSSQIKINYLSIYTFILFNLVHIVAFGNEMSSECQKFNALLCLKNNTLNLTDSINKRNHQIKTHLQVFELFYWDSCLMGLNRSTMLLYQVSYRASLLNTYGAGYMTQMWKIVLIQKDFNMFRNPAQWLKHIEVITVLCKEPHKKEICINCLYYLWP